MRRGRAHRSRRRTPRRMNPVATRLGIRLGLFCAILFWLILGMVSDWYVEIQSRWQVWTVLAVIALACFLLPVAVLGLIHRFTRGARFWQPDAALRFLPWCRAHKKRLVRVVLALLLAAGTLFGYRTWKSACLKSYIEKIELWTAKRVLIPNELHIVDRQGWSNLNWLRIGTGSSFFIVQANGRRPMTLIFEIESGLSFVRLREFVIALEYTPPPTEVRAIAASIAQSEPAPTISLAQARQLSAEQWVNLSANSPMGTVRVQIDEKIVEEDRPLILRKVFSWMFKKPPAPATSTCNADKAMEPTKSDRSFDTHEDR